MGWHKLYLCVDLGLAIELYILELGDRLTDGQTFLEMRNAAYENEGSMVHSALAIAIPFAMKILDTHSGKTIQYCH